MYLNDIVEEIKKTNMVDVLRNWKPKLDRFLLTRMAHEVFKLPYI
jgi:hypothetical protein